MSRNLFKHLVMILTIIIEEVATVPSGIMDCIITQFENYAEVSCEVGFSVSSECSSNPRRLPSSWL